MAANLWRFTYQLPIAAPGLGEALMRRESVTRRVLRAGWGDRDTWDEQAAASYAAVQAQPQAARAASLLYRTFVTREALPFATGAFAGRRLGVPARLVVGRDDPLGAGFADGFERHGDDARAEILEGCGHFVPEERPRPRRRARPRARRCRLTAAGRGRGRPASSSAPPAGGVAPAYVNCGGWGGRVSGATTATSDSPPAADAATARDHSDVGVSSGIARSDRAEAAFGAAASVAAA